MLPGFWPPSLSILAWANGLLHFFGDTPCARLKRCGSYKQLIEPFAECGCVSSGHHSACCNTPFPVLGFR